MGIGEHFEGVKQHWAGNFAFLDYFKKVYGRAEPLPKWSDTDVEESIATDPVYGRQLKALRESRKFVLGGALVGAAHLGGVAIKYSKAPHGVLLATGFRAITGAVLGAEVAEHWYQLYKMDKQRANLRFIYWWEDKVELNPGVASSVALPSLSPLLLFDIVCVGKGEDYCLNLEKTFSEKIANAEESLKKMK